ncbi:hypothetical protein [Verrucomicrobium spinosum]|uniref:hypothetical protein n=1 Tax=Verrucomicrobium spinosum TaxID=2736 RepID=UPI0001744C5A|nr:hypothetical protein [Verrucomicrobium spinosum]
MSKRYEFVATGIASAIWYWSVYHSGLSNLQLVASCVCVIFIVALSVWIFNLRYEREIKKKLVKRRGIATQDLRGTYYAYEENNSLLLTFEAKKRYVIRVAKSVVAHLRSTRRVSPSLLLALRMFLPRKQREEIDLIISDLVEDIKEMKAARRGGIYIRCVVGWHTVRTIIAYLWDGSLRIFRKIIPLAALFRKLGF